MKYPKKRNYFLLSNFFAYLKTNKKNHFIVKVKILNCTMKYSKRKLILWYSKYRYTINNTKSA